MDTLQIDCPFEKGEVYVYGATQKVGCSAVVKSMLNDDVVINDMGCARCTLTKGEQIVLVYANWNHIKKYWFTLPNVIFIDVTRLCYTDAYWKLIHNNTEMLNELMRLLPEDNAARLKREALIQEAICLSK